MFRDIPGPTGRGLPGGGGQVWGWAPSDRGSQIPQNFQSDIKRHGMNIFFDPDKYSRRPVAAITHTMCPRALQSNACTPADGRIAPNDTCRQAVFWNQSTSDDIGIGLGSDEGLEVGASDLDQAGNCGGASIPPDGGAASNLTVFSEDGLQESKTLFYSMASLASNTGTSGDFVATSRPRRWNQVVHTVFPPGTVAEVPLFYDGWFRSSDKVLSKFVNRDYAWRVNPSHVILVTTGLGALTKFSNSPNVLMTGLCESVSVPGFNLASVPVLLDDPSCVE